MKKVLLALLVLALSMPAIAGVTISIEQAPGEVNAVLVKYVATEEVRAFALDVTVTDSALMTSKTLRQGLTRPQSDDANYYVTPTNAGFNTVGGVTRVWNNPGYGSPIAQADGNACTIEMASLYASNDPCVAHRFAPPLSGTLVKLYVNQAKRGWDNAITITVTQANAKRGGIVLKNGTTVAPTGLPAAITLTYDCMLQGEKCGGVQIDATKYANWVTAGKPASWCHPAHYAGDATLDCLVNAIDVVGGTGKANFKAAFNKAYGVAGYAPECDTNDDLIINAVDLVGGDPTCVGCGAKANFNQTIHAAGAGTPCP